MIGSSGVIAGENNVTLHPFFIQVLDLDGKTELYTFDRVMAEGMTMARRLVYGTLSCEGLLANEVILRGHQITDE